MALLVQRKGLYCRASSNTLKFLYKQKYKGKIYRTLSLLLLFLFEQHRRIRDCYRQLSFSDLIH